ncbi:MAG: alcohol dehydrogenase catalytic domain-containing protein [Streptosporangiales bacterium]|nr:alcohol dehydrogenase catalytic domain-containing protein [Streptosporangiales bacterium]
MRALVVEAPGEIRVRDVARPSPGGHALVQVERAGLCGTDLKIISGAVPVRTPRILGHELVGRVVVPAAGGRFAEGTRVVVDPVVSCGRCPVCRADLPHLCPDGGLIGRDRDGGAAAYLTVPEERLHRVPDDLGMDAAALLQVLATCVHAQEPVEVPVGGTAVVVGLGVTGQIHAQLLALRGAGRVVGVTRSVAKRELAERLGAYAAVPPSEAEGVVRDLTGGLGGDLVVECAGTPETLSLAMRLAGPGGTVLCYGTIAPHADQVPTYDWYLKELRLLGARAARPRDFPRAIALAAGPLRLAPLLTATYPLDRAADAVAACADPTQLKVVLDP